MLSNMMNNTTCCLLLVQVLAFSATFTAELLADLEPLMRRPQKVRGGGAAAAAAFCC
jgi:hypothetical protein